MRKACYDNIYEVATALGTRWPFTSVSRALRARNPEKVRKRSPGASGPWKKSGQSLESLEKVSKRSRKDSFETFSGLSGGPGAGGPGRLFSKLFGGLGPEGPRDPCKWPTDSELWQPSEFFICIKTDLALIFQCLSLGGGCSNPQQQNPWCLWEREREQYIFSRSHNYKRNFPKCWAGPSAELCRGFLLYKFCILPGIFLEDFSGHFFPQKWGEKIRRPKNKNPRKIRSAKNRPKTMSWCDRQRALQIDYYQITFTCDV